MAKVFDLESSKIAENESTLSAFKEELTRILTYQDVISKIKDMLADFEDGLKEAHVHNEFIDSELAIDLKVTSQALLFVCETELTAPHVPYSLAAILYFVRSDDGNDDWSDLEGFEDDKIVLETVIQKFNLSDQVEHAKKEHKSA